MTLQFALTPAPASQPRNIILGQTVVMTISLGVSYANSMEVYIRQALATALTIMVMTKFVIVHPPAGASALLFAGGGQTWSNMLTMLVGNIVAIIVAVIINNYNDGRSYPTYWGLGFLIDYYRARKEKYR